MSKRLTNKPKHKNKGLSKESVTMLQRYKRYEREERYSVTMLQY